MIYVRPPTTAEQLELKHMTRHAIGRVSQRAHMVRLSAQHRSVPEIATLFSVSRTTVRFWLRRFDAHGPSGLRDDPRSGRPRTITPALDQAIAQALATDPQQVDPQYLATCWTSAMLVLLLVAKHAVTVGRTTVRNALQRLKRRWRRPRLAMPRKTDPEKTLKQWRIVEAVIAAGPAAVVLYADESRVQTLPLLRAMWQQIGHQVRVPTPGSNTTRAVFGALNIRTGQWHYHVRLRMRQDDFVAFLEYLLVAYPTQTIILIVDNYSSHTAHAVRAWRAAHPRMQVHFLPKYCSHLNPVEPIWLQMKNQVAANRLYGSITVVVQTIETFFARMTPTQALTWAGVET